ncbi:MAG: lipase family protein [Phycisphaerae bacterium]|nr:lipase family protein [Saprospiraceae bacterium]
MSDPTLESIQQSFSRLQNGLPLFQQDIFNIAWEFTFSPTQYPLLKEIHSYNQKLAESLLLFRKRLQQAAVDADLESALDHLVLHYIINTDGPIPELEDEDPFDVFDAATRYAQTLCVRVSKRDSGDSILHVNGKEVLCPGWAPGVSAAWALRQVGPVINRARYGRNDIIPSVAFGFDPNRVDYRLKNAMILADFSQLAYFEPGYVEEHTRQWGYETFRWVEDPDTDTQVFVAGKGEYLIVCFRGTSNGRDALVDLNFFKTNAIGGRGRVHQGFQQSLEGVWDRLQLAVDDLGANKKIFICGHSLGAALGQLAAHRFALKAYQVAGVYVFGSPRVGNQEFKRAYNELLEAQTYLHINHEDIVPQIPPQLFGFHDLGGLPRKFDRSYSISGPDVLLEDDGIELDFENLDAQRLQAYQKTMTAVQTSIKASTHFLNTKSQQFNGLHHGTGFESGGVDDHSMDQYLFKFGCAILDGEWERLERKGGKA